MIPCKLTLPPDRYRQVSVCLNRVHLRGLTIDEAMLKLTELGLTPELRYQPRYVAIDRTTSVILERSPQNLPNKRALQVAII